MKFCVLASGSKGNCTYLEVNNNKYLIDIGISYTYLEQKLKEIKVSPKEIKGIFITHLHQDHIVGLPRFLKLFNPTVYLSENMLKKLPTPLKNHVIIDSVIELDNLVVEAINLSHDTECNGYVFSSHKSELVYITDTGYINVKYHKKLTNKTAYIFESNHDIDLLMKSKRPHHVKMRTLSDSGHISNKDCAYYLSKFIGDRTKFIILAHISEESNTEELAIANIEDLLKEDTNVVAASQTDRTGVIEL